MRVSGAGRTPLMLGQGAAVAAVARKGWVTPRPAPSMVSAGVGGWVGGRWVTSVGEWVGGRHPGRGVQPDYSAEHAQRRLDDVVDADTC